MDFYSQKLLYCYLEVRIRETTSFHGSPVILPKTQIISIFGVGGTVAPVYTLYIFHLLSGIVVLLLPRIASSVWIYTNQVMVDGLRVYSGKVMEVT